MRQIVPRRIHLTVGHEQDVTTDGPVVFLRLRIIACEQAGRRNQPRAPRHADVMIGEAFGFQVVDIIVEGGLVDLVVGNDRAVLRSEEHTSEIPSLNTNSYAVY